MSKNPKNIIIFADGTGQSEDSQYNTNVLKLSRLVEDSNPVAKQHVFYDPGVGLGSDVMDKAFGHGLPENVRQCYSEICKHYDEGDRIYLFGFSRGAATVASLANFLALFGCLDVGASYEKNLAAAWKIYKGSNSKRQAALFCKKHKTKDCQIECLGVWDIVPALPKDQSFHDFGLNEKINHAYHALALDEYDPMFRPFVWNVPNTHQGLVKRTIKQVWFIGVHSDVGGGYEDCSLSDITLDWMIKNARRHDLKMPSAPQPKPMLRAVFMADAATRHVNRVCVCHPLWASRYFTKAF